MNSYGSVLSAATVLPATSAATFLFAEKVHPVVLFGLMAVNAISLIYLMAAVTRYLINRK